MSSINRTDRDNTFKTPVFLNSLIQQKIKKMKMNEIKQYISDKSSFVNQNAIYVTIEPQCDVFEQIFGLK